MLPQSISIIVGHEGSKDVHINDTPYNTAVEVESYHIRMIPRMVAETEECINIGFREELD